MKHLWSPWRMTYIENHNPDEACVFCAAAALPDSPENLIVARGRQAFVILNRYPYTSGHLMIVPYVHTPALDGLDSPTLSEMMELTRRGIKILQGIYRPQGLNVGSTSVKRPGPASWTTFICISCRGGSAIPILCPPWVKPGCCLKIWNEPTNASGRPGRSRTPANDNR